MQYRVVVDTNVWISILIGRKVAQFVKILSQPEVQLVVSDQLLNEIIEVTSRPKFAKYFPQDKVQYLVSSLRQVGMSFPIQPPFPKRCRDGKDDYLIALAEESKADFIITGDADLLVLQHYNKCQMVTVAMFEAIVLKSTTGAQVAN